MSFFSRFRKAPPAPAPVEPRDAVPPAAPATPAVDAAAAAAQEEATLRDAMASGDFPAVSRAVVGGSSTRIRQLAAEAIDDPQQIRELIRKVRGGNDKNVYRILTRKRDALLARERDVELQQAEIGAASAEIERHSRRVYDSLFTPHLEQLEGRWNAVAAGAEPAIAQKTQQAIDRAREVIAQHLRQVAAQAAAELAAANAAAAARAQREQEEHAAAEAAAERARVEEEDRKARSGKLEAEAQALGQIGGLLRKAHGALASGSSRTAAGLRRAIEEKIAGAPPLPAHLASQLKQLDTRLEELKDWKSFSVAPKRIELIERMEALIGATMHPTALAGQIRSLQEQWRTLSKGAGGGDAEAEWQRFHEASQQAFQPCREFFEAQDRLKQENLQRRGELFERLLAFEQRQDWEQPDWRMTITALREARQLWRGHSPVDPVAGEPLEQQFSELAAALQGRIDAEYARNVRTKKSLIERARGLLSAPDSRAAAEEVKRLQDTWKSVGPVSREDDRTLWEAFREQCDALFQKRQQEFDSRNAALETHRLQASGLCDELDAIAGLTGQALLEGARKLPELRLAFDAIEELPRASTRQLQDRFERAFERCRRAVAQQHARDAERGWIELFDAANAVRAYRLAAAKQADAAQLDALKQAAEARLAGAAPFPKGSVEALQAALERAGDDDLAANELALRQLCIRAEILADRASPAEDLALRREYQLRRLQQGMGQGSAAPESLDALAFEWLAVGPVEEVSYLRLAERFRNCRRQLVR
ncbi:MAG TPA: DUF349 domain-containing protein [Povalibacter sp.]|uniref:DUF349 domain-containing protein n=1 Tax=Povalibacter sp. TaxID=1962978 RepID=UPI002C017C10|nr:DUF349 domain-containing protein [Povalibacter sp.]HMN43676.1 DUF349 domain-containing protein [Povalibacter sp.]